MSTGFSMVIAGTTGLVGQSTLAHALINDNINLVYSLSRRAINNENSKCIQWIDPRLIPPIIDNIEEIPTIGVIALGTTMKKAGSKDKLKEVDVNLVIQVAEEMLKIGVQHLFVISSLGASINARSHYLRCKGEMEESVQQLDFMSITFLQPGPLSGERKEVRKDEKIVQSLMKIFNPLLFGWLKNIKPIHAQDIANTIIYLANQNYDKKNNRVNRINSANMLKVINKVKQSL